MIKVVVRAFQYFSKETFRQVAGKIVDLAGLAFLMTFAFFISFKAGERGFFSLDQSLFFDGAYRIFCGQIPFKDFFMPVGPITFWVHAISFKLFGVSYFSHLLGAAVINSFAAIIAVFILRLFFPQRLFLSYLGGVLTAICFYPPYGTPSYEQTAMFFVLLTILMTTIVVTNKLLSPALGYLFLFIAGIFMAASFLSKQNIVFLFPVFFLLLLAAGSNLRETIQRVVILLSGLISTLAVFILWIWKYASLKIFWYSFFIIVSEMGSSRFKKCFGKLIAFKNFGSQELINMMHLAILLSLSGFFFYFIWSNREKEIYRHVFLASILCFYGISFQYFFMGTTYNAAEVTSSLAGVIFVLSVGIYYEVWRAATDALKEKGSYNFSAKMDVIKGFVTAIILLSAYGFAQNGVMVAFNRRVHEFRTYTKFSDRMPIERLRYLRWGHPTIIQGMEVEESDFVDLYEYLKRRDQNFFIFSDYTIFYGLVGKPSPQPLLWFHKGSTFPLKYNATIDQMIVDGLRKNNVQAVVVEKVSFLMTKLQDFPLLEEYINSNFIKKQEIGIFSIFEKSTP